MVTMLRNPIERVLSEFRQLRSGRQPAGDPEAARCPEQAAARACDRAVRAHQWGVAQWLQCKGERCTVSQERESERREREREREIEEPPRAEA
jgi:hypothetical protein